MSDLIDCACEREQLDRDLAIAAATHHAPELPSIGQCYNCLEPMPDGRRFCDRDCLHDYMTRKRCEALRG